MNTLDTSTDQRLHLEDEGINYLNQISKWSKFLSIVGFIFIGLVLIIGVVLGIFMRSGSDVIPGFDGLFIAVIYIALGLIYVYPVLRLYQFSINAKVAIEEEDTTKLTHSFGRLKSVFRFIGILMIITMSIYALMIIVMVGFGGLAMLG